MGRPRRPFGRLALAGAVLVVATWIVSGAAAESFVGVGAPLPPPDSCIAPLLPCYIVLSTDSGSRGNAVTVTGYQFWPGEPLTVYFWNGVPGASAPAVAQGSTGTGSFSVSFDVPKDPVGNFTVFVVDLAGDNQSARFHVTHLTATPGSGPVAGTISVSGQGFLPDHVVKFHVRGVLASTSARCTTNRHGNFSGCVVVVPNAPTGKGLLTATDGTYTARVAFTVS